MTKITSTAKLYRRSEDATEVVFGKGFRSLIHQKEIKRRNSDLKRERRNTGVDQKGE
jgi:hypothetical protein